MISDVREKVQDLTTRCRPYDNSQVFPAMLRSLDYTRTLPSRVHEDRSGTAPGSRPPGDISWPSSAQEIRQEAICWDAALRNSLVHRSAVVALDSIPVNADIAPDKQLRQLRVDVNRWHRAAAILLGYLDPILDMPQLYRRPCFGCQKVQVHGVARAQSALCYYCGEEYSASRIRLLIRQQDTPDKLGNTK